VREALAISKPVIFEGNGYSAEWVVEAERRGLPHLRNTPEAVAALHTEAATALFTRHGVLTADELHSRYHIRVERYLTTVAIEATVIRELVDQFVLPDALSERTAVSASVAQARAAGVELDESDLAHLQGLQAAIVSLRKARAQVDAVESSLSALEGQDKANAAGSKLVPALANLRAAADAVEVLVADQRWSLPRYREMLFQNG
jgi:glutamine synthetase